MLIKHCLKFGFPSWKIESLIKECYILNFEKEGCEMRDASEYATLLNSTGRYDKAEIGFHVCLGDRIKYYYKATKLLHEHRTNLANSLNYVKKIGFIQLENIQYFDGGDKIKETIIGIVAGMSIGLKGYNINKPIIALANSGNEIKVSSRATNDLIKKGINLSKAMYIASEIVGGAGGGHDIAAGATIQKTKIIMFIKIIDEIIGKQKII